MLNNMNGDSISPATNHVREYLSSRIWSRRISNLGDRRNQCESDICFLSGPIGLARDYQGNKQPASIFASISSSESPQQFCATCPHPSAINRAQIGLHKHVPKWDSGLKLKYVIRTETFRTPNEAVYVASKFAAAIASWGTEIGVTFCSVQRDAEAHFCVVYKDTPDDGSKDVLAQVFFPNDGPPEDRTVYIHATSFEPQHINNQIGILAHEVGHILGLRHGFAKTEEPEWSIRFGQRYKSSVMERHDNTALYRVTDNDRRQVKEFYRSTKKTMDGRDVKTFIPQEHRY